jgi:UDP-4-amino-4-deoxy-L-arabinose-oxoglutarate aminotransferase
MGTIPFFAHDLGAAELEAIAAVFRGRILTTGETVATFERRFSEYLGVRHTIAVTSCTGAMHLALLGLNIGPGDEVITTPLTFIATSTAILEAGASPVFVDVEPTTGNLDADAVESAITERTRAIMPVHLYGLMCDMRALQGVAERYGLAIVEDAAHCVEGERAGSRPGALSEAACFSFYATKSLTCGEGGAVVTNDDALAERLRLLRLHGMTKNAYDRAREGYQHWDMVCLGWKYNMDNIQAAMLLPQLERLEHKWQQRELAARRYYERFAMNRRVRMPYIPAEARHGRHLFPVWVIPDRRDAIVEGLRARGIETVVNYRAIHLLSFFEERFKLSRGSFPVAERIGDSTISLPFYAGIPDGHIDAVAEALNELA